MAKRKGLKPCYKCKGTGEVSTQYYYGEPLNICICGKCKGKGYL